LALEKKNRRTGFGISRPLWSFASGKETQPGMSLRREDFDYSLPDELIARYPLAARDASRMMVLHCGEQRIEHTVFRELPRFLMPGDLAVLNNSRVIRARLPVPKENSEVFLIEPRGDHRWLCLVRPGRKWRVGSIHQVAGQEVSVEEVLPGGERILAFSHAPDCERFGSVPLPPYLKREATEEDVVRYQNVYAQDPGSVAAPTAGLHFTEEMLGQIPHTFLTLHVGLGTFQPVKVSDLSAHQMHEEKYCFPPEAATEINRAERILAVGTTVIRVLESRPPGPLQPGTGQTRLFITPPHRFQHVDLLLTNFHLPQSTLLMLVCALGGMDFVLQAYAEAVREKYRFFSYGDCMLVLPEKPSVRGIGRQQGNRDGLPDS